MKYNKFTYQKSGVNIQSADKFVEFLRKNTGKKKHKNKNIGGFGSITGIPKNYKDPSIVASTDGVGTKIEIANLLNKFDTIGIDLVAMSVNDLIVQGAKPLIFLDYISINKINLKKLKSILIGINKGCVLSECKLVGGETAEMPGTYSKNKFDIAGFSVGLVENNKILSKRNIKVNDLIIATGDNGNDIYDGKIINTDRLLQKFIHEQIDTNSISQFITNEFDNRLIGNSDGNLLLSGIGDDYVEGGDGDDQLFGREGNDSLIGGNGKDSVFLLGEKPQYTVLEHGDCVIIIDSEFERDGLDKLSSIELFTFSISILGLEINSTWSSSISDLFSCALRCIKAD